MELFATDREPPAFLLETDAALDFEALEAQAEAAAEKPWPPQRPKYIALVFDNAKEGKTSRKDIREFLPEAKAHPVYFDSP